MDREEINAAFSAWSAEPGRAWSDNFADDMRDRHNVEVRLCEFCSEYDTADSMEGDAFHGFICRPCRTNGDHTVCASCNNWESRNNTYYIEDRDFRVCETCVENEYSYCDHCEVYVADPHNHADEDDEGGNETCGRGNDGCDARGKDFTVNIGNGIMLEADKRTVYQLAGGEVDDVGRNRIVNTLVMWSDELFLNSIAATRLDRAKIGCLVADIQSEAFESKWETKEGKYPRRLSRYAYKTHALKIPAPILERIGNMAQESSAAAPEFHLEFTREFNLSARHFAHADSCWWQSYYASRCYAKSNGMFGMRTFNPSSQAGSGDYHDVTGRAWVSPFKLDVSHMASAPLAPTTFTEIGEGKAQGFIVFNGYGALSAINAARALAEMHGLAYKRIGFYASPMYINNDRGFIVGTPELIAKFDEVRYASTQHSDLYKKEQG